MITQSLAPSARLRRSANVVATWSKDQLVLYFERQQARYEFNQAAALVWLFCGGKLSITEIVESIQELYPVQADIVENDVRESLFDLYQAQLLEIAESEEGDRTLLKVAFCNFWPSFDKSENYFVRMLAHRFDILHVSPDDEPNLLIYSTYPSSGFDHVNVDRSKTIKVLYNSASINTDFAQCDYAFSCAHVVPSDYADRHYRLPLWSLYVTWDGQENSEDKIPYQRLLMSRINEIDHKRDHFYGILERYDADRSDEFVERLHELCPHSVSTEGHEQSITVSADCTFMQGIEKLTDCKFTIVFENFSYSEYCAEKLLQALVAGTVPIYYGDPQAIQDFNPYAFINGHDFKSFEDVIDYIRKVDNDTMLYQGFLAEPIFRNEQSLQPYRSEFVCKHLEQALYHKNTPIPSALAENTASTRSQTKLTIGMATYDDFDGVYFTVQSIRLYHPEVTQDTEILLLDNNPNGACAQTLRNLGDCIPGYRYVPYCEIQGTAIRDMIFREANSDYVLCLDSHVLLETGSIRKLIDYFDTHPNCSDLLQGPMVYDNLTTVSTHFEPVWREGIYGTWGTDERGQDPDQTPFEISMQGLGLFACRRDAWLGFNPLFRGFGGEEGYIHEKFRRAGRKTLCLPFLRWLHRFHRPRGTQYLNVWQDRIRNYLIGFEELGLDTESVKAHFRELVNTAIVEQVSYDLQCEQANPFSFFDAIYCINLDSASERWQAMQARFEKLGILKRVRHFRAIETPESHHIGCTLSHRSIIKRAKQQGFKNVLVFEDDAVFVEDTLLYLLNSINELKTLEWDLFYLGGCRWSYQFSKPEGCRYLQKIDGRSLTSTHAVAYNHTAYEQILNEIPDNIGDLRVWIETHYAIDQYLNIIANRFITSPDLVSQPSLLQYQMQAYKERFTL